MHVSPAGSFLNRSAAALGGILAAACSLTESLWPGTGPPLPRAAPVTLRVLYGPWIREAMYTAGPVDYTGPDGGPYTPDREWFHATVAPAFRERYPGEHGLLRLPSRSAQPGLGAAPGRNRPGHLPDRRSA